MGHFGPIRVHLALPKTADLTSIDVRDISVIVNRDTRGAPTWSISPTECGGGEFKRNYQIRIRQDSARVILEDDRKASRGQVFEPFAIDPGEKVFFDYDAHVCDAATYQFTFLIRYVAEGEERTISAPEAGPITMTGLAARSDYIIWNGALKRSRPGSDIDHC